MTNADAIDLFDRVKMGTTVVVQFGRHPSDPIQRKMYRTNISSQHTKAG